MGKDKQEYAGKVWMQLPRRAVLVVLRLTLGCIFVFASYDKILHPQAFSVAVENYQILPAAYINFVSITLPWLELVIGLCLLFGLWLPGASVLGSGLLTAFIVLLIYNQVRGVDISCGCFTTEVSSETSGIGTVLRDVGFLALSMILTVMILFPKTVKREISNQNA